MLAVGVALPFTVELGFGFLLLGFAATFLMYHLWRYPYDQDTRTSAAPKWAMWIHRGLGYAFALVYVIMMWHMVPRLWTYQVELPARTVVHVVLGMTIGFLLLIKISILRFFRHFEEAMPYLGTAILGCTVLLLGLSMPAWLREHSMAHGAPGGDPFSEPSRERVARLLPEAGLPDGVDLDELSSERALRDGRDVLVEKCVRCHDLKTILDKPRQPSGWWGVVDRMGDKPALFAPFSDADLFHVTAYLIAITPDLQKAVKRKRREEQARDESVDEAAPDAGVAPLDAGVAPPPRDAGVAAPPPSDAGAATTPPPPKPEPPAPPPIDPARARATFERVCSQCHETADVDGNPPRTRAQVNAVVRRMVEKNGLEASRKELDLVRWWLLQHYVLQTR